MRTTFLTAAALVALLLPPAAAADSSGTVSAQVTVATPCVTVGNNLDYGTLPFSTSDPFVSVTKSSSTSYTNCSVTSEKIYVRGTTATSTTSNAVWDKLTGTNTCNTMPNVYSHSVGDDQGGKFLTLTDQLLNPAVAAGATKTLNTNLEMPCSGSSGAGETMTFSIIVTASF